MAKPIKLEDLLKEAEVLKIDIKDIDTVDKAVAAINAKKQADAEDAKKQKEDAKQLKIQITKPVAGLYKLSANVGDTITIEAKQAEAIIETGHAKKA